MRRIWDPTDATGGHPYRSSGRRLAARLQPHADEPLHILLAQLFVLALCLVRIALDLHAGRWDFEGGLAVLIAFVVGTMTVRFAR